MSFVNNPRRYAVGRGDYFSRFFWSVLISLLLHLIVLGDFSLGHKASTFMPQADKPLSVSLSHRGSVSSSSNTDISAKHQPYIAETEVQPRKGIFSRSTAQKMADQSAVNDVDIAENDGELSVIDEMDAAEYRLALARVLVQLQSGGDSMRAGAGEISLKLLRHQRGGPAVLSVQAFSVAPEDGEEWRALMQAAIDQTPLPAAWMGRPFKLSLKLRLLPIQSVEGSACNSCS